MNSKYSKWEYSWENIKKSYKNNKFKISASTWNEKYELPMDHILCQIFKIILNIYKKNMDKRMLISQ